MLTWKAQVVGVRSVPAGATVGYNATFVATEPMRLALVSAGYADGLDRSLGNRFSLLVRGQRAPLVGRVSMDQSVLDVTEIPGVQAGDEVVILGAQGAETITAFDHAAASGTIPWEVFTRMARASAIASSAGTDVTGRFKLRLLSPHSREISAFSCTDSGCRRAHLCCAHRCGDHRLCADARVQQHVVEPARAPLLLIKLADHHGAALIEAARCCSACCA